MSKWKENTCIIPVKTTQIFHDINLGNCRCSKSVILTVLEALNSDLGHFQTLKKCNNVPKTKFTTSKFVENFIFFTFKNP